MGGLAARTRELGVVAAGLGRLPRFWFDLLLARRVKRGQHGYETLQLADAT